MRSYLGLFFIAALFSLLVTPAVRTLGHWLRAYGQADEGREQPHIPRLGGLASGVAPLAALGGVLFVPNETRGRVLSEGRAVFALMGPAPFVVVCGVVVGPEG